MRMTLGDRQIRYGRDSLLFRTWCIHALRQISCGLGSTCEGVRATKMKRIRKDAKVTKPRLGRPTLRTAELLTNQILEGATTLFLEQGFARTKMDEIAKTCGISKQTVYARFDSKYALFEALVMRYGPLLFDPADAPSYDNDPVRYVLLQFATEVVSNLRQPEVQRFFALVAAESRNFPELASQFWDIGPGRFRVRLRPYLEQQVLRGTLEITDLTFAVEQMAALLAGPLVARIVVGRPPFFDNDATAKRWIESAVEIFLQTYGTPLVHGAKGNPAHRSEIKISNKAKIPVNKKTKSKAR
jgi:TetR/AcrR family transcriptional regulator, mexJK operon transcriptional repressor